MPESFLVNGIEIEKKNKPQLRSGHRGLVLRLWMHQEVDAGVTDGWKEIRSYLHFQYHRRRHWRDVWPSRWRLGTKRQKRAGVTIVLQVWVRAALMRLGWTRVCTWGWTAWYHPPINPSSLCVHAPGWVSSYKTVPSAASQVIGQGLKTTTGLAASPVLHWNKMHTSTHALVCPPTS